LEDATWRRGFCGFDTFSKVARSVLFALDLEMNLQPLRKCAKVKISFLLLEKRTAAGGDFFAFDLGGAVTLE
jgi:hypothetical protein